MKDLASSSVLSYCCVYSGITRYDVILMLLMTNNIVTQQTLNRQAPVISGNVYKTQLYSNPP